MICSTFLEDIVSRLTDLNNRVSVSVAPLSDDQRNWRPGEGLWSIGQILSHVEITNRAYLPLMDRAIERASFGSVDAQVRHTFFGSLVINAAGPSGNVPAPKALVPGEGPFGVECIDAFHADHQRFVELAGKAEAVDLSQTKVRNPLFPVFKMNLADCFEAAASHGERHVGQIEELVRRSDFPKN